MQGARNTLKSREPLHQPGVSGGVATRWLCDSKEGMSKTLLRIPFNWRPLLAEDDSATGRAGGIYQ